MQNLYVPYLQQQKIYYYVCVRNCNNSNM